MSPFFRMHPRIWWIIPVCAFGFLVWTDHGRMQRVELVSGLAGRAAPADVPAPGSPTGYANGQRELIVPGRNENSFDWITQTQQMLARGEWRVRHVDSDNAPFGREVNAASPYRWWLGLVAWFDHLFSGRPAGLSVERAALLADPLLHALMLIGCTAFVARRFGAFAAALVSIGLVTVFPFAAGFLPGAPDSRALAGVCALGSVLVLLAGMRVPLIEPDASMGRQTRRWFALAGIIGGLGVWISVSTQVPIVVGVFIGALIAAWVGRRPATANPAGNPGDWPWRTWGLGGGVTVLVCYVAEYFPAHLGSWRLESIHPLYGLAWIAGGELLTRAVAWIRGGRAPWRLRDLLVVALSVAAVATVPVVMGRTGGPGFLARDLLWARLSGLPNGSVAGSLGAWLVHDGATPAAWATLLPLVVIVPAAWLLLRRTTALESRMSLAVAFGPVLVALGFACWQLSWWSLLDGTLLVLLAAATAQRAEAGPRPNRLLWSALVGLCAVSGLIQLLPPKSGGAALALNAPEAEELIERHLAHWLAGRTGEQGVVVFAPPHETTALCFYGGLRGIGTFAAENRAGFGTTLMIAGVTTMEEVQELLRGRGVRYIVIPSWDRFFDDFAQLYLAKNFSNRTSFFVRELRRWNLPPWLRPVPYQLPVSGGFEGQSVMVFEVVDEQSPVVATSRLAEYLVETGQLDQAASAGEALRRFPADVGALAARVQVLSARNDPAGAAQTLDTLLARLSDGADRYLPWDRRVSLAIVLARGNRVEPAREQVKRCLAELDEARLRSLTTGSLYGLQVLGRAFGLEIADQRLRVLAVDLLPPDLRGRL